MMGTTSVLGVGAQARIRRAMHVRVEGPEADAVRPVDRRAGVAKEEGMERRHKMNDARNHILILCCSNPS